MVKLRASPYPTASDIMLLMAIQQTCRRDGDAADNNEIDMKFIVQAHWFAVLIHSLHQHNTTQPASLLHRLQAQHFIHTPWAIKTCHSTFVHIQWRF